MPLTRRQFLSIAGISAAAAALPPISLGLPPSFDALYGRALGSTAVYAAPDANAPLIERLWSDTVVPILDASSGWYRLQNGYAPRQGLQPMTSAARRSEPH